MLHGNRPLSIRKWGVASSLVLSPRLLTVQRSSKASKARVGAAGTAFSVSTAAYCSSSERSSWGRKPHALFVKGSQHFSERRFRDKSGQGSRE